VPTEQGIPSKRYFTGLTLRIEPVELRQMETTPNETLLDRTLPDKKSGVMMSDVKLSRRPRSEGWEKVLRVGVRTVPDSGI